MTEQDRQDLHDRMMKEIELQRERRAKMLAEFEMTDEDGYPTEECLDIIKNWHWSDPVGWFAFIKEYWWAPDFGWHESDEPHEFRKDRMVHQYRLSTGGWSGNESIIRAMEQNRSMWHLNWVQSRRGGHYIFEIYNVSEG